MAGEDVWVCRSCLTVASAGMRDVNDYLRLHGVRA